MWRYRAHRIFGAPLGMKSRRGHPDGPSMRVLRDLHPALWQSRGSREKRASTAERPRMGRGRPMRVLHIISRLGAGGAEQQLRLLLRHVPVRCEVVALAAPGRTAHGIRADGIPVTHLPLDGRAGELRALPALVRTIPSGGYDLVHTHLYRACVYGRIAARLAGGRAGTAPRQAV